MEDSSGKEADSKSSKVDKESLFYPDSRLEPGATNVKLFNGRIDIHPVVFPASLVIIGLVVVTTLLFQPIASLIGLQTTNGELMTATAAFSALQKWGTQTFNWLLVLTMSGAILTVIYFAAGKYGSIRIGGPNAEKEFSDFSWIAMLFSAGMGIGLIVYSVSEPMSSFQSVPPFFSGVEPRTPMASKVALVQSLFHWALAPWGIYALVGLGLAFFSFNRGLPLTFRSIFWPILGDRIYGWPGHVIDTVSIFATLFGLATSLGLGVKQANAGIAIVANQLLGVEVPQTTGTQVVLIALVTLIATGSVIAGLEKGVKRLSTVNAYLMLTLLAFLLLVGPTIYLIGNFISVFGTYIASLPELSLYTGTFTGTNGFEWLTNWTFFYWAWWIAWSPFVGMFIARISKGRTIREFVTGVLLVPTLFGALWFSTLGGAGLYAQLHGANILSVLNKQGQAAVIYATLSQYPLGLVTSIIATILVIGIFVTSSDSGSLVINSLAAGGKQNVPVVQRTFWALIEGAVAAVLLIGGGLTALQAASIATGIPFAVVLLLMCYTVYQGLKNEYKIMESDAFKEWSKETINQNEKNEIASEVSYGSIIGNRENEPSTNDD